jgi:hypothetical protein
MNASRWEQLISSYIPNLRIFDVWFDIVMSPINNQRRIRSEITQFISSFWTERGWFFQYIYYPTKRDDHAIFHSANPYRYC